MPSLGHGVRSKAIELVPPADLSRPCPSHDWDPRVAHLWSLESLLGCAPRCCPVLVLEVVPEPSRAQEAGNFELGVVLSLGHIEAEAADDIEDENERP